MNKVISVRKALELFLKEAPSIHCGFGWDAEWLMLGFDDGSYVYAVEIPRSKILHFLLPLSTLEECSEKSGGGYHLRISRTVKIRQQVMAMYGDISDKVDRIHKICSLAEFDKYNTEYMELFGHKAKNKGRTFEWLVHKKFGVDYKPNNDRLNGESDIVINGQRYEIKCCAAGSKAQIKINLDFLNQD